MKNMIKLVSGILAVASVSTMFVACGDKEESKVPAGATKYTFGAELTDVEKLQGAGFSGSATGKGMIVIDNNSALNSLTGYYIDYLYVENTAIIYTITSDSDVTDAKIWLSLSGCGAPKEYTFAPDGFKDELDDGYSAGEAINYTIELNGTAIDYSPISMFDLGESSPTTAFNQYEIAVNMTLKKGVNTIKLITSNSILVAGTAAASAPVVDALQIQTKAKLTMEEHPSNLPQSE